MSDSKVADLKSVQVVVDEKNVFLSPECPVRKVTVYSDRAEVCRQIDTTVVQGVNEIVLKKLPASIDSDSIRVEGTGQASIAEVSFQRKFETSEQADLSSKEKELEGQLKDLTREKDKLTAQQNVLKKQWTLLDNFGDTVSKSSKEGGPTLDGQFFKGVSDFIKLFKDEGEKLELSQLKLREQILKLEEKIATTDQNLKKLRGDRKDKKVSQECTIVLESQGDYKVTLLVSYVVSQASWTPSYDIRMFTAEGLLKIQYYGQITQSTGEDWTDAKLFLSTATPSIGGTVPELSVAVLSVKQSFTRAFRSKRSKRTSSLSMVAQSDELLACGLADFGLSHMMNKSAEIEPLSYTKTKVQDTTTSASYEIARQSSIPSDNLPHKVSVGIFDVKPTLEYVTVPKVAPRAFLRAKVVNSSAFTLLAGATSIFLDNSFVAKAEIKSVSPGEEFVCSLGVDPAVRVNYKPLKKFRESKGFVGKNTCMTYEQRIEVKNTHDYKVSLQVKDQLPRTSDEKIKVSLLEPVLDMKHPEKNKNPHMNKQNHVIWNIDVDKQGAREVTLKYTIEHPLKENIETSEVFEEDYDTTMYL